MGLEDANVWGWGGFFGGLGCVVQKGTSTNACGGLLDFRDVMGAELSPMGIWQALGSVPYRRVLGYRT